MRSQFKFLIELVSPSLLDKTVSDVGFQIAAVTEQVFTLAIVAAHEGSMTNLDLKAAVKAFG